MVDQPRVTPGDPNWGKGRSPRSTGYRARSYYVPDDVHFRLRNAWWHTQQVEGGWDSMSELVVDALRTVLRELEESHNDGEPFDEIPERRRPKAGPSGRERQAAAVRQLHAERRAEEEGQTEKKTKTR